MHQSFSRCPSLSFDNAGRLRKSFQKFSNDPSYSSRSARADWRNSGR
jgi:hypothetical protein